MCLSGVLAAELFDKYFLKKEELQHFAVIKTKLVKMPWGFMITQTFGLKDNHVYFKIWGEVEVDNATM